MKKLYARSKKPRKVAFLLRMPPDVLEKLDRMVAKTVQSRGQWITKAIIETPEPE